MKKVSVLSLLSVITSPVFAQESVAVTETLPADVVAQFEKQTSNSNVKFPHGLQFGLGLSLASGLNGFVGYSNKDINSFWAKRFGVRFDFASYSPIKSRVNKELNDVIGDDGLKINENIKLKDLEFNAEHYGLIVDFYPFGDTWFLGGLRLSGGYMTGKLDANAGFFGYEKMGRIGFVLNDYFYSYVDNQMRGRALASWKYNGPYLGTGFDLGIFKGFKLFMDAGVVFTGKAPKVDLNIPLQPRLQNSAGTNIVKDSSDPVEQAAYDLFIENREAALADARHEIKDYKYYPMIKVGFMYRF